MYSICHFLCGTLLNQGESLQWSLVLSIPLNLSLFDAWPGGPPANTKLTLG